MIRSESEGYPSCFFQSPSYLHVLLNDVLLVPARDLGLEVLLLSADVLVLAVHRRAGGVLKKLLYVARRVAPVPIREGQLLRLTSRELSNSTIVCCHLLVQEDLKLVIILAYCICDFVNHKWRYTMRTCPSQAMKKLGFKFLLFFKVGSTQI